MKSATDTRAEERAIGKLRHALEQVVGFVGFDDGGADQLSSKGKVGQTLEGPDEQQVSLRPAGQVPIQNGHEGGVVARRTLWGGNGDMHTGGGPAERR